ncbi:MAG: hypothetical protein A3J66_03525 [Candidatus Magasanikbacteria bacterium RIFCSPHIGHO2_02_FULL_47_14]|uniref:Uncharacterized protein n=1 Tax=Candidatus Magasanikbacteria bacterium RIFCSPHIGHO2_02_FULL_47_14 TaxID=1798680 RepID=A0A1F6MB06_9BACT|nr:MAG: hypothetical protein A3J66_03525 [Candidatus Magasanikbacteria bacterium RIFCSPHIGHO2_02_FULL_47_14]
MDTTELIKDVMALLFQLESVPYELRQKAVDLVLEHADDVLLLEELKEKLSVFFVNTEVNFVRDAQALVSVE